MDAASWDERYSARDLVWGTEPNRFIRRHCERLPVGRALDLGCGEGRNALWLASLGWRAVGVDFSSVAIERARAATAALPPFHALRLRWTVADVTEYRMRAASLDLVIVCYLHIPPEERDETLASAASALRANGHLVVVGHDLRNLTEGVSGPQEAELLYSPEPMRELLRERGLVVEVAATLERPTEDGIALDTVVRARRPA